MTAGISLWAITYHLDKKVRFTGQATGDVNAAKARQSVSSQWTAMSPLMTFHPDSAVQKDTVITAGNVDIRVSSFSLHSAWCNVRHSAHAEIRQVVTGSHPRTFMAIARFG